MPTQVPEFCMMYRYIPGIHIHFQECSFTECSVSNMFIKKPMFYRDRLREKETPKYRTNKMTKLTLSTAFISGVCPWSLGLCQLGSAPTAKASSMTLRLRACAARYSRASAWRPDTSSYDVVLRVSGSTSEPDSQSSSSRAGMEINVCCC